MVSRYKRVGFWHFVRWWLACQKLFSQRFHFNLFYTLQSRTYSLGRDVRDGLQITVCPLLAQGLRLREFITGEAKKETVLFSRVIYVLGLLLDILSHWTSVVKVWGRSFPHFYCWDLENSDAQVLVCDTQCFIVQTKRTQVKMLASKTIAIAND